MDWTTFSDIGTAVYAVRMKIGTRDGLKEAIKQRNARYIEGIVIPELRRMNGLKLQFPPFSIGVG